MRKNANRRPMLAAAIGMACALGLSASALAQDLSPDGIWQAQRQQMRNMICPGPDVTPRPYSEISDHRKQAMEPVKVFDNFYMLGTKTITAWALTTPEGIILFDAMLSTSVLETVEQSMIKLGLDPADVKYVVISHAHNDHFGGARYLQDKYGALVIMTEKDWSHLHTWPQLGDPAPYPRKDMSVADGSSITLGGVSVNFVETPGHTPGTLASIFPVKDGENTHYVGYWGSSSVSFLPSAGIAQYMGSADRFMRIDPRVDVPLANHPMIDGSLMKAEALKQRRRGAPHPFVTGNDGFRRLMQAIHDCAGEVMDAKVAAGE